MLGVKDIHTHDREATDAVVNVDAREVERFITSHPGVPVSIGIHPWDTDGDVDMDLVEREAVRPEVVAIGECGLDKLRGAPLERQEAIFRRHAALSERLGKPLIIHCVKAWSEVVRLKKELQPRQPWIIHGFRGSAQLARQLVDNGFYLSLGEKFNSATLRVIPADRLLYETDTSLLHINNIIEKVRKIQGE